MANPWPARKDDAFNTDFETFLTWANVPANGTAAGFGAEDFSQLDATKSSWDPAYAAKLAYDAQGLPITQTKDDSRAAAEAVLRPLAEQMRARFKQGKLTASDLIAAGLPAPDMVPSAAPVPTTWPVVTIDASVRLAHTYNWRDSATPGSKAKPAKVKHAELRLFIAPAATAAPADPADFPVQIIDPATPNPHTFDSALAGQRATVVARWVSTAGDPGPWSPEVSALIQP